MNAYHTLQEFMLYTESMIYVIIVLALACFAGFWRFLSGADDAYSDEQKGWSDKDV